MLVKVGSMKKLVMDLDPVVANWVMPVVKVCFTMVAQNVDGEIDIVD